ncbi:MAG: Crp/Fnr family transcriptional regulator [Cytophagaceae bacterium]|jgi:CRP-like cAMP-binding protein|nr:Crp/Fnr family transcriptional regulator [Cytophagaceae bacterium]
MLELSKIQRYLSLFTNLSLSDILHLFTLVKERKLKAGEIYIHEGVVHKKVAYIKKGIVRGFMMKSNGEEATMVLRSEDEFVASYHSLLHKTGSKATYHALEDCVLLEIEYDKLMETIDKNPHYHSGRKFFLSNIAEDLLNRLEGFILLTPEERYDVFLKKNTTLAKRVPDKYIASYLGITPVSLSRIRARKSKRS